MRPTWLLLLLAGCATRAPALHTNPVVKVEYRGERPMELYRGSGSGFFANGTGDIVTNYHVVTKADVKLVQIVVTVDGRWLYPARVVHADPEADLAIVRIDPDPATLIPFLRLGRGAHAGAVLAVQGYPGGGAFREARGKVARRGQLLECTIPVRVGNSGGPALWPDGTVAGVVTGLRKRSFSGPRAKVTAEFSLVIPVETLRARLAQWNVAFH